MIQNDGFSNIFQFLREHMATSVAIAVAILFILLELLPLSRKIVESLIPSLIPRRSKRKEPAEVVIKLKTGGEVRVRNFDPKNEESIRKFVEKLGLSDEHAKPSE